MVSHALTVETRQRTPFSLKTPTQVYALASLLQQLRRSWNEQWESNRAYTTLMLQSYDPPKYPPPQNVSKNEGSLATIQETAISSAWNHIFHIQQRGPPRRSARKLLSRCQTRRSASRSPCLPWQPMDQPKNSELEHNYAISLRTN